MQHPVLRPVLVSNMDYFVPVQTLLLLDQIGLIHGSAVPVWFKNGLKPTISFFFFCDPWIKDQL